MCYGTYVTIFLVFWHLQHHQLRQNRTGTGMAKHDSVLRGDKGLSMVQFELQQLLGEFARSSKAPINFMSVSPSARIYQYCFHWTDFLEI